MADDAGSGSNDDGPQESSGVLESDAVTHAVDKVGRFTGAAMPAWLPKAFILFFTLQLLFQVADGMVTALRTLMLIGLVSLFLSLAIEPAVNAFARRGMKRGLATGLLLFTITTVGLLFVGAIGSVAVQQTRELAQDAPGYIDDLERFLNDRLDTTFEFDSLSQQFTSDSGALSDFAQTAAGNALGIGSAAVAVLFQGFTVLLFSFYLVAEGPKLRRAICSTLRPAQQREVLRAWELAIAKTGGYLYSRVALALLSGLFAFVVFRLIELPYSLALAAFVGFVSQFIPVIGTYIAGVFPIVIALVNDPVKAIYVAVFLIVYQQIENYLLAPRITARTMALHPAIAFASVLAGSAILGPVGTLLALPAAASIQAFSSTYVRRHEVIDSPLLDSYERRPRRARPVHESADSPDS